MSTLRSLCLHRVRRRSLSACGKIDFVSLSKKKKKKREREREREREDQTELWILSMSAWKPDPAGERQEVTEQQECVTKSKGDKRKFNSLFFSVFF